MNVIEEAVSIKEAVKVFGIIEKVLRKQMSTQIYVANALYEELYNNGAKDHVHHSHLIKPSHYNDDDLWLSHAMDGSLNEPIHLACFVKNCVDYMQLAHFKASKLDYAHFEERFKQLLLIEVKK